MDNYFQNYEEILRIPPRPARPKVQKPKFTLNYYEVLRQQNNILNSTVKTNALLSQVSESRGLRKAREQEEQPLSRLEPTVFVDELIQKQQLTRDVAGRIPSQRELERRREEEELSPEQLGTMVGASITKQKASELQQHERADKETAISPTAVRIIQGKMPVREMQELTRDRIADLNAEQQYEKMVDYDGVVAEQSEFAPFIPQPDAEREHVSIEEVRENIVDMILNGIPASLLVHIDQGSLREKLSDSTLLRYGDLKALASAVESEQTSLEEYKYYSEPTEADFFHALYLHHEPKAFEKDSIIKRDDYEPERQISIEQAVDAIDAQPKSIAYTAAFTNQELAEFASDYGNFFADSLVKLEEALQQSRRDIYAYHLGILQRDAEFARLADTQASVEDSNMLQMGVPQMQLCEIEYEARLQSREAVHHRFEEMEEQLSILFQEKNEALTGLAAAELAQTSVFRHPHLNLAWDNMNSFEDFLVEQEVSLDPESPPEVGSIRKIDSFLRDGLESGDPDAADNMAKLFKALQIDIHDKLDLFMCVTDEFSTLADIVTQLNALRNDHNYFETNLSALKEQISAFGNEQMREHVAEKADKLRNEVIQRKLDFLANYRQYGFIKPQKMKVDAWYDYNANKFSTLAAK